MTSVYQNNSRSLKQKGINSPGSKQVYFPPKVRQENKRIYSREIKSKNEKILEIFNEEFEEIFPNILLISKEEFLTEIFQRTEIIINEYFRNKDINENSFQEYINQSKKTIKEKYEINYNILSKSYNNYISRPKNFSCLKQFRKHCIQTDDYAYHSCEYPYSKLIEIPNEKNKEEIIYIICSNCKKCYFPKQISLKCYNCKVDYYSCLLPKDEDPNVLPATWEKYHCGGLINETMKCIKCKNTFYLNLRENILICKNKRCNFSAKPQSIIWNCAVCKKEFKSDAKIYNPLEIETMKKAVNLALIFKKPIYPNEINCCKANPKELLFYHRDDCKGELFEGIYNNKEIIVCSKCHAMNFFDKFIWTCPLCKKRFRNSRRYEDKYISLRSTETNSTFNNFINNYNSNNNPILRSSSGGNRILTSFNSTNALNMRYTTGFNENKNHIINLVTEVYPNSGKKLGEHHRHKNKKQYSTLIEILAERNNKNRESSNNGNDKELKKSNSQSKYNDNDVNENRSKVIIINNSNNNDPNIGDLRKITSKSTKDNSLSNKSYGNNSNPASNKIKKITINKNEINNDDEEQVLNINRIEKDNISEERSRRLKRFGKDNNNSKKDINEENVNNIKNKDEKEDNNENKKDIKNNSIKNERYLVKENNSHKKEEKIIIKEKISKKEKSQEINKKTNKDLENENLPPKNSLLTLIPNKNRRKLDFSQKEDLSYQEQMKNNNNNLLGDTQDDEFCTSPEQLNEIIKDGIIPLFNIENYVFKNPIGEGSFGKIYLIQKEKTHEKYALKKIICHDLNEIKQFKKEFELVYSKVHNNIMKIYNIEYKCLDSTTYSIYVLMELAVSDWNTEIKRRQKKREYYTEEEIVNLLHQITDALIFLEENGIAHRDIKPQNILIYPNNIYKVADFGEARNLSDSIQECTLRGSELYMSPVLYYCLKNRQRDVIHNAYKSDVFSLGYCLLYAMVLTVQVLNDIREVNNMNFIHQTIKRALRRNYSIKMQDLVNHMLELDENKRFSFKDIKKYLNDNFK